MGEIVAATKQNVIIYYFTVYLHTDLNSDKKKLLSLCLSVWVRSLLIRFSRWQPQAGNRNVKAPK